MSIMTDLVILGLGRYSPTASNELPTCGKPAFGTLRRPIPLPLAPLTLASHEEKPAKMELNIIRQGNAARYAPPNIADIVVDSGQGTYRGRSRIVKPVGVDTEHPILQAFDGSNTADGRTLQQKVHDVVGGDACVTVGVFLVGFEDRAGEEHDPGVATVLIIVRPDTMVFERATEVVSSVCRLLEG